MKTPANVLKQSPTTQQDGKPAATKDLSGKRLPPKFRRSNDPDDCPRRRVDARCKDGLRDRSCASRSMVCYYDCNISRFASHKTGARAQSSML